MTPRRATITLLALALAAALGAAAFPVLRSDPAAGMSPNFELPGSARSNAARAISEVFDRIANREQVGWGWSLSAQMSQHPERFARDVPSILIAIRPDYCDWGPSCGGLVPSEHGPVLSGSADVLSSATVDAIVNGDLDSAVALTQSQLGLARHAAVCRGYWGGLAASTPAENGLKSINSMLGSGKLTAANARELLRAIAWLEGPAPLHMADRIRLDADLIADELATGTVPRALVSAGCASIDLSDARPETAEPFRRAARRVADVWGRPDFVKQVSIIRRDLSGETLQDWILPPYDQFPTVESDLAEGVRIVSLALRSLASPESPLPNP